MKLKLEQGIRPELGEMCRITDENGVELPGVVSVKVVAPGNAIPIVIVEFAVGDDFDVSAFLDRNSGGSEQ